jgi:lipid-A-disaccharide synthase
MASDGTVAGRAVSPAAALAARAPRADVAPLRQVIVTINGPGEVAAWLYPFAAALRERDPRTRLAVALLPCVFASGAERRVVESMPGVDVVWGPERSMRWVLRGDAPGDHDPGLPGCVLHLGGELTLAIVLARRISRALVVYSEGRVPWSAFVDRICLVDAEAMPGADAAKARVVGNLMVDAAHRRVPARRPARRTIALFPGSRPYQVRNMLPFLLKVAAEVSRASGGDVRWVLAQSDFVTRDALASFAAADADRVIEGEAARLERRGARDVLVTDAGVECDVASPSEAMSRASLALTIPGTNTAELAALGIPMLLLLPTYQLHTLPMPGLAGHVGGVPVLGPLIKRLVAEGYLRTRRHWAHPNRIARERVVPELVGRLTADGVARQVLEALGSPLARTARRLREVMGEPGSADRLVTEVLRAASTSGPRAD